MAKGHARTLEKFPKCNKSKGRLVIGYSRPKPVPKKAAR